MNLATTTRINVMTLLTKGRVRMSREGDVYPEGIGLGVNLLGMVDHQWCWVYEQWGEIKGALLASPCHGTALLWRLWVAPDSDMHAANKLLKQFRRDSESRGIKGFITMLDTTTETGKRLKSLMERCGGREFGQLTIMSSPWRKR